MVNSQVIKEIIDALKLDIRVEGVPTPIPVIEVGVKNIKNALTAGNVAYNSISAVILTAPLTQDCYILSASISVTKDVTSTSIASRIQYYNENGVASYICLITSLSLTVQSETKSITFPHQIKVLRGSVISITNSTNVANCSSWGEISYLLDEVS